MVGLRDLRLAEKYFDTRVTTTKKNVDGTQSKWEKVWKKKCEEARERREREKHTRSSTTSMNDTSACEDRGGFYCHQMAAQL